MNRKAAFTLLELLVVVAVMAILAALLFPAISAAKGRAQRTVCLNNLKQINLGMRLYWDDHADFPPGTKNTTSAPFAYWTGYKELMKNYVGLKGASSPADGLFACPADTFYYDFIPKTNHLVYNAKSLHDQSDSDFSSYWSNAGALTTDTNAPGLKGKMIGSVRHPSKSILVAEMTSFWPYSWHQPKRFPADLSEALTFNDAKNVVGFVDGHVSYIPIYWDSGRTSTGAYTFSMNYDPPAGYDYQWSGN